MKTLADRVNKRMTDLELSQEDLAKRVGISQTAIHKIATGQTTNPRCIMKLAKALKVSAEWLESGIGDMCSSTLLSNTEEYPEPRPPVIEENDWKALSPKTRALVEDFITKSSDGKLTEHHVKALQNMVDLLSKD